ncbi:MAG: hypothetical protein K2Y37_26850 [Pirellulales bacterium]|nr:hypothetical protein [Pirellulales bacterium]
MSRIVLLALLLLASIGPASLGLEPVKPAPPGEPAAAEFVEFVDELAKTMNARDAAFYQEHLNLKQMVSRAIRDLSADQELADGLLQGINQGGGLPIAIARAMGDKGTYLPLWVRTAKGRTRAMMRMLTSEGALNYHELLLAKSADDHIEAIDIYVFASGETMSQTLRRGALNVIAATKKSLVSKLLEGEQDFLKHASTIGAVHQANLAGKYQEALDEYAKLPPKIQADKSLSIARIQASMHVNQDLYIASLDDFAKQFPNDPAGDLMLIDAGFLRKEFDKCLATLDRLDKRVGGDPYLNAVRANVALVQGQADEAKKLFTATIEGAPRVPQPYFALVEISLNEKQYAETARLMAILESDLGIRFPDDLAQNELFKGFSASPEYAAWQAKRAKP